MSQGWGPPGGGGGYGPPPGGAPPGGYGPPPGGAPPGAPGGYGPPPGPQGGGYGPPPGPQGGPPQSGGYAPQPQGQQMQYAGPPMGAIEIKTGFFFLQWVLFLVSTRIEINGMVQERPWGTHRFDLPAGGYNIRVWFPYIFMSQCGMGQIQVPVNPGAVTVLEYSAPFFLIMGGTISPRGMRPMMGMAPPGY